MPTTIELPDPETGRIIPTTHYFITEVAQMFHTNRAWIREQIDAGIFPHRRIAGRAVMSADHVAQALAAVTYEPEPLAQLEAEAPPPTRRLGTVVDPDDIEGVQ